MVLARKGLSLIIRRLDSDTSGGSCDERYSSSRVDTSEYL